MSRVGGDLRSKGGGVGDPRRAETSANPVGGANGRISTLGGSTLRQPILCKRSVVSEMRYSAWGSVRYSSGDNPTDYTYTGQYSDSEIGLLDYVARRYDPQIGRFIQPDSIVPGPFNSQAYDHYAYGLNNPSRYTDPDGHRPIDEQGGKRGCSNSTYCRNGRPKTISELRQDGGNEGLIITAQQSPTILTITEPTRDDKGIKGILDYAVFMNNAIDFVTDLDRASGLMSKGFLWGKAINPDPRLDFGLGLAGQAISDLDSSLEFDQRLNRALAVGTQSAITGVVSDLGGALGLLAGEAIVPEGGGIVGYPVAAVAVSIYLDEVVWKNFNVEFFEANGWGAFP